MNRIKIIPLIIALLFCTLSFCGCGEKQPTSINEFESKMTERGYNVNVSAPTTSPCVTAVARKNNYDILFYEVLADEDGSSASDESRTALSVTYAIKLFESITNEITFRSSPSETNTVDSENASYFSFETESTYCAVTRFENTIMFASVNSQYKDEIIDIFNSFGYSAD